MYDEGGVLGNVLSALIGKNNGEGWGSNLLWIIVLGFFFLIGGRGSWFGGGNGPGNVATKDDVFGATAWSRTQNQIEGLGLSALNLGNQIEKSVLVQNAETRNEICRSTGTITGGIAQAAFTTQSVGQNIERAIDAAKYEAKENTQKVLDKLCTMESNGLMLKLNEANMREQTSNVNNIVANAIAQIVGAVRPYPIPTFAVGGGWYKGYAPGVSYGNFT